MGHQEKGPASIFESFNLQAVFTDNRDTIPQLLQRKISFTERFKHRNPLRLHMSLIFMATVCSGFMATRIMLAMNLDNVLVRYPLVVLFGYLIFFVLVKLWLKHVAITPAAHK